MSVTALYLQTSSLEFTPEDANLTLLIDVELMRRVAQNDAGAVRELHERVASPMAQVAIHVLRSQADADDVVQWALARLWRHASEFSERRGTLRSWSAAIVRRKAIDLLRAREIHLRASKRIEIEGTESGPEHGGDALLARENHAEVRAALETLIETERCAISLSFFDGMSHEQIASRQRVPIGTVKTRIRRGMRKLRPVLLHLKHPA